jgi:hypothetical protein
VSQTLGDALCAHADPVVAWRARRRLARESETTPAMRRLRSAIGASPIAQRLLKEYTNVKKTDRIESRGTYADFGPLSKRKGHPLVTVDALWVLQEAGRG